MRKPNIRSAAADFVFAAVALVVGLAGLPLPYLALTFAASAAVWAWTRRETLDAMALRTRLVNSALALIMIGVVLAIAYWIGLALGGHT
jgi:hypothetical protein